MCLVLCQIIDVSKMDRKQREDAINEVSETEMGHIQGI